jgi:hypothetical protein
MNKPFNVGDEVFDIRKGNGIVSGIDRLNIYVTFSALDKVSYTKGGFWAPSDKFPSLYHGHDLIVTVKEPEYEWQILNKNITFELPLELTSRFYSSLEQFWEDTGLNPDIMKAELFEPSKRLVK